MGQDTSLRNFPYEGEVFHVVKILQGKCFL